MKENIALKDESWGRTYLGFCDTNCFHSLVGKAAGMDKKRYEFESQQGMTLYYYFVIVSVFWAKNSHDLSKQ